MNYICNLPNPIIIQRKVIGGQGIFEAAEVETLYFKEPSINELRCNFAPVRNAFKQIQHSIPQEKKAEIKKNEAEDGDHPLKKAITEPQEARKLGYGILEGLDVGDFEKIITFQKAFKLYLAKGCAFTDPSLSKESQLIMTETITDEILEEILAMYLGYFLPFFMLRNPKVMKEWI